MKKLFFINFVLILLLSTSCFHSQDARVANLPNSSDVTAYNVKTQASIERIHGNLRAVENESNALHKTAEKINANANGEQE